MKQRIARRPKRYHQEFNREPETHEQGHSAGYQDEEDSEDEIKGSARRAKRPKKAQDIVANQQNRASNGLTQSRLSFGKAVPATSTPLTHSPESTQGATVNSAELGDDLIQDEVENDASSFSHPQNVVNGPRIQSTKARTGKHAVFKANSLRHRTTSRTPLQENSVHDVSTSLPWAQRYPPKSLEELGVHKRKVADVRSWIDNVLKGYERKRLLVLHGPSGSGKTTTVQLLSSALKFRILEWRNPVTNATATGEYRSTTASFEDFLSRGQRYDSLDLQNPHSLDPTKDTSLDDSAEAAQRIILMEEDPHNYSSNSSNLQSFRDSIKRYLIAEDSVFATSISGARAAAGLRSRPPIIMIISESSDSTSNDVMSAHRLLGPEILNHPRITSIEFNPVAVTILGKALECAVAKARADCAIAMEISPAIIKRIAECGDLRAGIAALEFMCRRAPPDHESGRVCLPSKAKFKPRTKKRAGTELTPAEVQLIDTVTTRSSALDLFHAVGKVVYNKRQSAAPTAELRDARDTSDPTVSAAALVSEVDPERLIEETGSDVYTFLAALHENYVLSCSGPAFNSAVNDCTEALSVADILGTDPTALRRGSIMFATSSIAADAGHLHQVELAALVAVRGLLVGLPYPVNRSASEGLSAGRETYKMFFPESMRVRIRAEEVMESVKCWLGSTAEAVEGSSGRAMLARHHPLMQSSQDAILADLPYAALIAASGSGTKQEEEFVKALERVVGLTISQWITVEDTTIAKDRERRVAWKRGTDGGQRQEVRSKEDNDNIQSFLTQEVDERWVLSNDDIIDE